MNSLRYCIVLPKTKPVEFISIAFIRLSTSFFTIYIYIYKFVKNILKRFFEIVNCIRLLSRALYYHGLKLRSHERTRISNILKTINRQTPNARNNYADDSAIRNGLRATEIRATNTVQRNRSVQSMLRMNSYSKGDNVIVPQCGNRTVGYERSRDHVWFRPRIRINRFRGVLTFYANSKSYATDNVSRVRLRFARSILAKTKTFRYTFILRAFRFQPIRRYARGDAAIVTWAVRCRKRLRGGISDRFTRPARDKLRYNATGN